MLPALWHVYACLHDADDFSAAFDISYAALLHAAFFADTPFRFCRRRHALFRQIISIFFAFSIMFTLFRFAATFS